MNGEDEIKEGMRDALRLRIYKKFLRGGQPETMIKDVENLVDFYIKQKGIEFLKEDE